jgi:hypothetical protein
VGASLDANAQFIARKTMAEPGDEQSASAKRLTFTGRTNIKATKTTTDRQDNK